MGLYYWKKIVFFESAIYLKKKKSFFFFSYFLLLHFLSYGNLNEYVIVWQRRGVVSILNHFSEARSGVYFESFADARSGVYFESFCRGAEWCVFWIILQRRGVVCSLFWIILQRRGVVCILKHFAEARSGVYFEALKNKSMVNQLIAMYFWYFCLKC